MISRLVYKSHKWEPGLFGPIEVDTSGSVELDKVAAIKQAGAEGEVMYIELKDGNTIGTHDNIITEFQFI